MWVKFVLSVYFISYLSALVALGFGFVEQAKYIAAPATLFAGLVFVGHLVTIDEEYPGEFSNPEYSQEVWADSLAELLIKGVAFVLVGAVYLA